ncbi:hypothetical protein DFH08DRAFT_828130 [Mycena albidolilacea]|uniref:Uncharacterized protein n=1 Tax=Mycena albidolilacea TaxID=1033008 RepID=A0AAD6YWZ5_9AGAR|nr:hypothetical protein DFH08DRAFT_828130 [Mycena albidolilacea]
MAPFPPNLPTSSPIHDCLATLLKSMESEIIATAVSVAARLVELCFADLVDRHPPSTLKTLLVLAWLVPPVLCTAAAWACLKRAGLAESPMANSLQISSSQVAAAAERDMLIFPAKEGGKGKTKAQLKDMCLQTLSEKFCNDPASCHKGPRNGPKKTQPKQLANRRAAIIDTERVTERSKDTRTADEVQDLLRWADRTVARLPYKAPESDVMLP